jgi:hypothetical protein
MARQGTATARLYVDITGLRRYVAHHLTVTGIQRVTLLFIKAAQHLLGNDRVFLS